MLHTEPKTDSQKIDEYQFPQEQQFKYQIKYNNQIWLRIQTEIFKLYTINLYKKELDIFI